MNRAARRLGRFFLLAFALIAGGLGYWGVVSQEALVTRQDNPRRVIAEQSIRQGEIVDRAGTVLVSSVPGDSAGLYTRRYFYPEVAPVVGHYSLRHGTSGVEDASKAALHGDQFLTPGQIWLNGLLHRSQAGGDVRLTILLPIQQAARKALQGHQGAVVVINAANGDILAMDSLPTYDPNLLDEAWDKLRADPASPLLNRATQALYQPGNVLQGVILGEAINNGMVRAEDAWSGAASARIDSATLPCAADQPPDPQTYATAFVWGCPGAIRWLGERLGANDVIRGFSDFGLTESPPFDLPVAAAGAQILEAGGDPGIDAIGQGRLTISPLHAALMTSAFANRGQMPAPRLVSAIRPPGQDWRPVANDATPRGTISGVSADAIKDLMLQSVETGATQAAYVPGRRIYGYAGLALSGPRSAFNTWFVGFTYDESGRPIVITILLEGTRDAGAASRMGGLILTESAALLDK